MHLKLGNLEFSSEKVINDTSWVTLTKPEVHPQVCLSLPCCCSDVHYGVTWACSSVSKMSQCQAMSRLVYDALVMTMPPRNQKKTHQKKKKTVIFHCWLWRSVSEPSVAIVKFFFFMLKDSNSSYTCPWIEAAEARQKNISMILILHSFTTFTRCSFSGFSKDLFIFVDQENRTKFDK